MPVYEYACKACSKEFEYQQRMSDPDKTTCEACGKEALERLISRTAFTLKGGGWYKDLYSSTKPSSGGDSGGSSGSSSSGGASGGGSDAGGSSGGGSSGGASSGGTSGGGDAGGSSSSGGGSAAKSAAGSAP